MASKEKEEVHEVRIFLASHWVCFIKGEAVNTLVHITFHSHS